ncbi:TonB-dependent receptor [Sulfurimonas sp. HSL-3221]|uniref:TonB-dependent receptor plug domain-containing protein n=1 Tax=Sulfurimonadaceae TaxID=2771471 RepID=UPI001E4A378E|nr:TonB-dependent receptor [Sulfurimonas sp. HSL-3221]UFS61901.1 TonB-dependent receptor [Sulfurimonas sp. HSL-3221]
MTKLGILLTCSLLSLPILSAEDNLYTKSMEGILSTESELKAQVGSRTNAVNYLESNIPIDVITQEQIARSGMTSLPDILRYFVAGFNAPETSIADGSDHVRTITLRGMSPDQILVLINGKRLHTSSLLHVNGTIGRGSSHADLDTIPLAMIEKIEIMRDGASAQYGSDAISAVINIIFKGIGNDTKAGVLYGGRKAGDGHQAAGNAFATIALPYDGFVNLSIDAKGQEQTQRAGLDRRVSPPALTTHVGIPDSDSLTIGLNAELAGEETTSLYLDGFLHHRNSRAGAFYRPELTAEGFPGFLPIINADILDYAVTAGIKGVNDSDITWDLSNTYGLNRIHYTVEDSLNYTQGDPQLRSFDNGSLQFTQNTVNFDITQRRSNYKFSAGAEYRYENYKILAGEQASYADYGVVSGVTAGTQGFAGYSPYNAVDECRSSYALYADSVFDLNERFNVEILVRYEEYSDFGESTNAKVALTYQVSPSLMLRSSGSTGFRAPSLSQSYYAQTSSFAGANGIDTQGTFRVDDPIAEALGAKPLKSERSKNVTLGGVYQYDGETALTVDFFYVEVNDRIMLSDDINNTSDLWPNVSKVRFFINAAHTSTHGVDIKFNKSYPIERFGMFRTGLWYNYNINKISGNGSDNSSADDATQKIRIEKGQPRHALRWLNNYSYRGLDATANISYFGTYSQMVDAKEYVFDPMWTLDADIAYRFDSGLTIAVGGHNLFDAVPNKWDGLSGTLYGYDGIKPYSRYSPNGYSGTFYYLRAEMTF